MKDHILNELLDASSSSRKHHPKPHKTRRPAAFDPEAPRREAMVAGRYGRPGLKQNILTRFWRSRLGQPWDEVWAEVVAGLSGHHDLLEQVRRHVGGECGRRPAVGFECPPLCWIFGGRTSPTNGKYERHVVFYVCPATARLMVLPRVEFHQMFGTAGGKLPLPPH